MPCHGCENNLENQESHLGEDGCLQTTCDEKQHSPYFYVYSDGACKGNPGLSAGGAVLYDASFNELDNISILFGLGTNNEAEYKAFIEGVKLCLRNKISLKRVIFRMDSEWVCKQLWKEYKVLNPNIKILYEKTQEFDIDFASQVQHVFRQENKRADELANKPFLKNL